MLMRMLLLLISFIRSCVLCYCVHLFFGFYEGWKEPSGSPRWEQLKHASPIGWSFNQPIGGRRTSAGQNMKAAYRSFLSLQQFSVFRGDEESAILIAARTDNTTGIVKMDFSFVFKWAIDVASHCSMHK